MILKNFRIGSLLVAGFTLACSTVALADTTYVSNQGHTEVFFGWSHAGVTRQNGEFTSAVATVVVGDDIADSTVNVEIDVASVKTGVSVLDDELKTDQFFDAETYPTMNFESTSVEMTGENTMNVNGNLTIHGVTKPVTLAAEMTLNGEHPLGKNFDSYKGKWIAFHATTEIDHQAFEVGGFSTGPIAITIGTELQAQ